MGERCSRSRPAAHTSKCTCVTSSRDLLAAVNLNAAVGGRRSCHVASAGVWPLARPWPVDRGCWSATSRRPRGRQRAGADPSAAPRPAVRARLRHAAYLTRHPSHPLRDRPGDDHVSKAWSSRRCRGSAGCHPGPARLKPQTAVRSPAPPACDRAATGPSFALANERTFLAWERTAMALLAAGVGTGIPRKAVPPSQLRNVTSAGYSSPVQRSLCGSKNDGVAAAAANKVEETSAEAGRRQVPPIQRAHVHLAATRMRS